MSSPKSRTAPPSLLALLLLLPLFGMAQAGWDPQQEVRIGVLAYRGKDLAIERWQQHAVYLGERLAPLRFKIVPLSYVHDELSRAVTDGNLEFVITNPGHYTELELAGHLTRIATRRLTGPNGPLDRFGGTAITRANRSDLADYRDLAGKHILIPSQSSLGGWQVHLREAVSQGMDPRKQARVSETKNHRTVVEKIVAGEADAGFVRSDLLEELAGRGLIDLSRLRLISPRKEPGYPYLLTTRLYPEWPFAVVNGTPSELATQVLQALLAMPEDSAAARDARIVGWTIPGHYQRIDELMRETGLGPYAAAHADLGALLRDQWPQLLLLLLVVLLLALTGWFKTRQLNRTLLRENQLRLDAEKRLRAMHESTECLYSISRLANDHRKSREQLLLETVDCIVKGLNTHHILAARFVLDGRSYPQDEFPDQLRTRRAEVKPRNQAGGFLEVAYETNAAPEQTGDRERENIERSLINTIAKQISRDLETFDSESQLRQSEMMLRTSQEIGHIGSWHLDTRNNELYCSDEMFRIFGFSPCQENRTYDHFMSAVHPEDRELVDNTYRLAREKHQSCRMIHRIVRPDGSVRTVEEIFQDRQDEKGDYTRFAGIIHDITERQQIENELQQAANVFEHTNDGVVITDEQNRIINVNRSFSELTGYSAAEVIGKDPGLLRSDRQDPEVYKQMWQSLQESGAWKGVLWNRKKNGEIFAELLTISVVRNQDGQINQYVGVFSDITEMKHQEQQLEHRAYHDALTQLPNRTLFADRLRMALLHCERTRQMLAICFIDLDGFKPVNDDFGHDIGDQLLIHVARRLKECVREGDSVARLGGDEFALFFTNLNGTGECLQAAERVLAAIAAPYQIQQFDIQISASIGVTLYPVDKGAGDELLKHADQAMYLAKGAGKNRVHLYNPEKDRFAGSRNVTLQRIVDGLQQGEFLLHYQPRLDTTANRCCAIEALARWAHPEHGLQNPDQFLAIIENSDFAPEFGRWVVTTSLQQMAHWIRQGMEPDICVNINIGSQFFYSEDFVDFLVAQLALYPELKNQQIELDILEHTVLENIVRTAQIIDRCRKLGIRVILDDFGRGYSSIAYFKRLPVDAIKIDQNHVRDMFTQDEEDMVMVNALIEFSRNFQRQVIAEGVESRQHAEVLLAMGCHLMQGYALARPMPAEALPQWLEECPREDWRKPEYHRWTHRLLPFLLVEQNHIAWIDALKEYLVSADKNLRPPPTLSHQDCYFGRWYAHYGVPMYSAYPVFRQLGECHESIHDLATELIQLKHRGQLQKLLDRLPLLDTGKQQMLALLNQLKRQVAEEENGAGL